MRRFCAVGAAGLSVAVIGLGGWAPARAPSPSVAETAMVEHFAIVTVQGRQVRIAAEFWRDVMPGVNGPLQLELRMTTTDARGLPADLRASIFRAVTASGQTWDGRMRPGEQFAHDPRSQRFEGGPGPRWPVGTLATGVFYFRDSTRTYRVPITQIPVQGAY